MYYHSWIKKRQGKKWQRQKKELRLRWYRSRLCRPPKGRGAWGKGRGDRGKKEKGTPAMWKQASIASIPWLLATPISMLRCLSTFHLIAFILWHLFNHTRRRRFWWHCGGARDMVSILFFFPHQSSTRVSLENNFFIQFYFLFLVSFYLPKKWRTLLTMGIAKCTKKWVFWSCKMLLFD